MAGCTCPGTASDAPDPALPHTPDGAPLSPPSPSLFLTPHMVPHTPLSLTAQKARCTRFFHHDGATYVARRDGGALLPPTTAVRLDHSGEGSMSCPARCVEARIRPPPRPRRRIWHSFSSVVDPALSSPMSLSMPGSG